MKTYLDCLPCLGKNAVDLARRLTDDPKTQREIVTASLSYLSGCDDKMSPPFHAQSIHDIARSCAKTALDPYLDEKRRSTRLAEDVLAELKKTPSCYNPDDFESRLRLAIAGNILDFGIYANLDLRDVMPTVMQAFTKAIDPNAIRELHECMDHASRILYLLDNCGEAVFDREFIAPYRHKTILGLRGGPVFNDVTRDDLTDSGLDGFACGVIDTGQNCPGVILQSATEEFKREFSRSDLVIAKGQGNFETLHDAPHNALAFLFMTKCPVICKLLKANQNSLQVIVRRSPAPTPAH